MITQQTPPTPAQRLAAKIRARTNDTRDILDLLHDIAQGEHDATEHDKLNATGILFDRGYGKAPKQAPVLSPVEACPEQSRRGPDTGSDPDPAPEAADNDVEAIRESSSLHESPPTEPESPRLVTQLDDSLHEALGPAPSPRPEPVEGADTPTRHSRESGNPESYDVSHSSELENPDPFDDPSSIQSIIRDHIISITNDGDTLIDVLMDIAWPDDPDACPEPRRRACPEQEPALSLSKGRRVKPFHRQKAGKMLLDRGAGKDPTPNITAVQVRPKPTQSDSHYPDYPPGYVFDPTKDCIYCSQSLNMPEGHEGEHRFDHEGMAKALEEVERMLEEQGITRDPNPPKIDWHISSPSKEWVANNIDLVREEAAKFREELELRIERQKAWPAIEERRRKKLAQIYPSHSEDEPPET